MNPPLHYSVPPPAEPTDLFRLVKEIHARLGWNRHPRNGKVARLPEPLRNRVNQMLEDGLRYRDIILKLQQDGCLPYALSEMNLSNWYRGGYQDWLRDKAKAAVGLPAKFDVTRPAYQQAAALKAEVPRSSPPQAPAAPAPLPPATPPMQLIAATPA